MYRSLNDAVLEYEIYCITIFLVYYKKTTEWWRAIQIAMLLQDIFLTGDLSLWYVNCQSAGGLFLFIF